MSRNYSKDTWRGVAQELAEHLNIAMDLPDDLGELCEAQDRRDAIRTLRVNPQSPYSLRS